MEPVSDFLSLVTNSLSHTTQRSPNLPNYITTCKMCVKDLRPSPQKRTREYWTICRTINKAATTQILTAHQTQTLTHRQPASSRKKHRKEKIETWLFNLRLETGGRSPKCRKLQAAQPTFRHRKIPTFGPQKTLTLSLSQESTEEVR
jgi:hypothetical protein